jgi:hypothetical protein
MFSSSRMLLYDNSGTQSTVEDKDAGKTKVMGRKRSRECLFGGLFSLAGFSAAWDQEFLACLNNNSLI